MGVSAICHSCGNRLDVPEDYQRNKMRCPECGVICTLPESAKGKSSSSKPALPAKSPTDSSTQAMDDLANQLWNEPEPTPASVPQPVAEAPRAREKSRRAEKPPARFAPPAMAFQDDDDGQPYEVVGGIEENCPSCSKPLPDGAVMCVSCGFDLQKGSKVAKEYQHIERNWESGWRYESRLTAFILASGFGPVMGILAALSQGSWYIFLTPWLGLVATLAFLMGTFDRIDLVRDKKGRVHVTKTWRFFFVPREPQKIDVRDYEGVITSQSQETGCLEWMLFTMFLPTVILAVLWWVFVIRRITFEVALSQDHGYPAQVLYRGWSQEHMNDIARTFRAVAQLP